MACYRNLSLQKKLVTALAVCVIFPLCVLGVAMNLFLSGNIRKKEYQMNQLTVNQAGEDLEQFFKNVEDLKYYCLTSYSVQDIVKGKGDANDYSSVGNWMEQTLRNDKRYYSVSLLSRDKNIEIQRGNLVEEEEQHIERALCLAEEGFWAGPHLEQRAATGKDDGRETVLSYYCGINDYERISDIVATLAVNLKESEVSKTYAGYMNQGSLNTCILDQEGTVLSSADKELLGKKTELFGIVEEAWKKQGDGYITIQWEEEVLVSYCRIPSWGGIW